MEKELKFPEGFFWGAATSAHQVEGGNFNDWSEWEKQNAERLAQIASLREWPNYILERYPNPLQPENYISGRACDHYRRYEEDFDIAKSLGHNAHRFSIEWSRVEPEEGKFNEVEIEHYRQVIKALRQRGLEPFVTLWHWTNPVWISKIGGWRNAKTKEYYLRFVKKIMESPGLGDAVKFYMPLNEPTGYIGLSYIKGTQPPGLKSLIKAQVVFDNIIKAYNQASDLIHSYFPEAKVGISYFITHHLPYRKTTLNKLLIEIVDYFGGQRFLERTKNKSDFIGVQYYRPEYINFRIGGNRLGLYDSFDFREEITDLGWGMFPEGLYLGLKNITKYHKPFFITENGIADARDFKRLKFIKDHLFWLHKAMAEGVNVKGYFYWSLTDNFEQPEVRGFWLRFGLIEIDYRTLERKIRPSAWEFAKICKSNSLEI